MPNILVTGLPGSGKTNLVESSRTLLGETKSFLNLSLADIVAKEAERLYGTPKNRLPFLANQVQQALRSYAIAFLSSFLTQHLEESIVIDTPLTMYTSGGNVPDVIFSSQQIGIIPLSYVVTVIDDAVTLAEEFKNSPYPTDPNRILDWIAFEVNIAKTLTTDYNNDGIVVRKLVIPRLHSDETIAKLIIDGDAPACYLGFPITKLKDNQDDTYQVKIDKGAAKKAIDSFRE